MGVTSGPLLIGRDTELSRLERGLRLVACAVILGLPGVGKSALARRVAASWPQTVWVHHASDGDSLPGLVDDLRRELGIGAPRALSSEPDHLAELADHLDRGAHLWLIEDADRIEGVDRLLMTLSARLRRARVIVTARGRIFAAGGDPERVEMVLDGLAEPAARQLWDHLDALYGPAAEFESAWRHSAGNPFQLRQAHAGVVDRDDPAAAAIATLDGDPRQLALALALAAEPVHRSVLVELFPGPRADEALRVLLRRLIIEPAGDGRFAVHDLLRGALLRDADPRTVQATHADLAAALEHAPLDEVVRVRARARHLLGAQQRGAARRLVLGSAQALIRVGAAAELLRCLDAVGDARDAEVQFARARTLVRMLDLRRAFDQMIALGADGQTATDEMRASLAHVAMLTGRIELAARVSRATLTSPDLTPTVRVRLSTVHVLTRTAMGEGEDARATICRPAAGPEPELVRAYLEFTRAFSMWLEERDADAEQVMRTASALCKGVLSFRAQVLAPLFASVLARTGNLAESRQMFCEIERGVADFEDPLVQLSQRMIRVTLLECDGAFEEALQLVEQVEATYHQAGLTFAALFARKYRGRLLVLTGRVRAGRACLDELARTATELGAHLVVRLAQDATRADPLQAITERAAPTSRPGELRRNRVIAAIRAVIEGRLEVARGYVVALEVERTLDPLSAALLKLARAGLATPGDRARLYEDALTQAAAAGADPELIPAIAARLGLCPGGSDDVAILIDTVHHEVRCEDRHGTRVVALARRPSVRRLLYTLAADLGRAHDKESLTRGIWNASYRPSRHDGALWVNIKRLREVLHGTGLRVDSGDEGYRLRVDDGHVLRTAGR